MAGYAYERVARYVLAGRAEQAISYLEAATRSCNALREPVVYVTSYWYLGQALEKKGDTKAACTAYLRLLDFWGRSKAKSVIAARARERSRALRCRQ
jgi:tetratricopeptide (TPR) repeat protein